MSLPITVHFLPDLLDPGLLPGSCAVVIDLLRASTTITRALDSGAAAVVPCPEPADALRLREALPGARARLGGERRGVRIDGFDLANSPSEYSPDAVRARTVLFTTTNGTRAVLRAREGGAARILIGCLNNRRALADALAADARPVRLICAGTDGRISLDDCLCAGAVADGILAAAPGGFALDGDEAHLALAGFRSACTPAEMLATLRESRGGSNLIALGLDADIADAARLDTSSTVPELDHATGAFAARAGALTP